MPGPLGTIAPTTDPNWAWDTPGWTNQGNTGDTEGAGLSAPSNPLAPNGAILSGVIAATMDAGAASVTGLTSLVTNTAYGAMVYVAAPAVTTKVFANDSTAGTTTHGYMLLTSLGGTVLAATADLTTTVGGAKSWAASTTLASGFYYLAIATTNSVTGVYSGAPVSAVTCGNGSGLVWAAGGPYPRFVTGAAVLTGTAPTSVTWAAQSTLGAAYISMY